MEKSYSQKQEFWSRYLRFIEDKCTIKNVTTSLDETGYTYCIIIIKHERKVLLKMANKLREQVKINEYGSIELRRKREDFTITMVIN